MGYKRKKKDPGWVTEVVEMSKLKVCLYIEGRRLFFLEVIRRTERSTVGHKESDGEILLLMVVKWRVKGVGFERR